MPKFKITTVTEEEIDLPEYPFYVKDVIRWVKHISENKCLVVQERLLFLGEAVGSDFCDLNYCSEQEFEENYNRVLKLITEGK